MSRFQSILFTIFFYIIKKQMIRRPASGRQCEPSAFHSFLILLIYFQTVAGKQNIIRNYSNVCQEYSAFLIQITKLGTKTDIHIELQVLSRRDDSVFLRRSQFWKKFREIKAPHVDSVPEHPFFFPEFSNVIKRHQEKRQIVTMVKHHPESKQRFS